MQKLGNRQLEENYRLIFWEIIIGDVSSIIYQGSLEMATSRNSFQEGNTAGNRCSGVCIF